MAVTDALLDIRVMDTASYCYRPVATVIRSAEEENIAVRLRLDVDHLPLL